jgi:hypothetical protein
MPGRGGFETIEQIRQVLQSEQNNTKPVEPERLTATLARIKERIASNHALQNQERLLKVLSDFIPPHFPVPRQAVLGTDLCPIPALLSILNAC